MIQTAPSFQSQTAHHLTCRLRSEEVHKAVYQAKLRKASGIDNIHAEILRNDTRIDLLFKIISYSFEHRCIPSD